VFAIFNQYLCISEELYECDMCDTYTGCAQGLRNKTRVVKTTPKKNSGLTIRIIIIIVLIMLLLFIMKPMRIS